MSAYVVMALVSALSQWCVMLLVRSISVPLNRAVDVARNIADGDLTRTVETGRGDDLGQLMLAMSDMNDRLRSLVGQVRDGPEGVAASSAEIAQGNSDLSARTEQQASALEETAASMEQLGATVKQYADSARQANQLAQAARAGEQGRGFAVVASEVRLQAGRSAEAAKEIKTLINASVE